jgi:predicted translin family RNA/ssDNA-binding protein
MKVKKKLATKTRSTKAVKSLPREVSLVSGRDRMWRFHYERLERSQKQTRDAKKEIKELKKKVDKLHATIGFLLTQ